MCLDNSTAWDDLHICTSIRQRISLSNLNSWRWRKSALESGLLESFSASLSVELSRDLLRV